MLWNISKAQAEISRLTTELETAKQERDAAVQSNAALAARIDTLTATNEAQAKEITGLKSKLVDAAHAVASAEASANLKVDALAAKKAAEIVAAQGVPPVSDKPKGASDKTEKPLFGRDRTIAATEAQLQKLNAQGALN